MATISYAEKYSKVVDEKFASESKSALVVNRDYDFVGAKTVKVYTISTSSMNNYGRDQTGTSRYGEVGNLDATAQELTMTRDRSFTFAKMSMAH